MQTRANFRPKTCRFFGRRLSLNSDQPSFPKPGAAHKREIFMTDSAALKRFETEGRLLKPTHNGPTPHGGRYGFRGDIVVTAEPPVTLTAAFAADDGDAGVSFLAGSLPSYKDLPALVGALGAGAKKDGKYFIYVSDLDRASRYRVQLEGLELYVLPIDDTSVYNELIDFLYLDKTKLKKFSTAEKLDAIADGAAKYDQAYESITYDEGLARL
jgi:hypothetical protein